MTTLSSWRNSQRYDGDQIRFRGGRPNELRCCDCGLVHTIIADKTVTMLFVANKRATAGSRNSKRWRSVAAAVRKSKAERGK